MVDFKVAIGLQTTELDAGLKKAQSQIGQVTTGIGKGLGAAVGANLGPFGELIEKANAFTGAMNGASMATKVFAGAVGLAMVGTTFLVKELVEAFREVREAQEDAAESSERLKNSQKTLAQDVLNNGIASGQESRTRKQLIERSALLVGDAPEVVAERKRINDALDDIRSGAAVRRGEQRLFNATLSGEAKAAGLERDIQARAQSATPEELAGMVAERDRLKQAFDTFRRGSTKAEADAANRTLQSIQTLDKIIAETEAVMKEREAKVPGLLADFFGTLDAESKARAEAAKTAKEDVGKSEVSLTPEPAMPSLSYGVSSAIGGGGNIYGATYSVSQTTLQIQAKHLASIDATLKNIERKGGSFR